MNRRDLFKAAAGAVVGGREAMRRFTFGPSAGLGAIPIDPPQKQEWVELPSVSPVEVKSIGRTALRVLGPPEHIKRQWREEAWYVAELDPDLKAMKSWSHSRKIVEQRRRSYAVRERRFWDRFDLEKIERDFYERYGFVDFSKP